MTRRRFYAPPGALSFDRKSIALGAEEARHLGNVLRLRTGDEVYVFDGEGKEFQCAIEARAGDCATLRVIAEVSPARPESPLDLTLAIALLKGEKFDLVVQKLTELGVSRVLPVITERASVRLQAEPDAQKRVSRWRRIALEAAKQSGRARVPEVRAPVNLEDLVQFRVAKRPELTATIALMFSERDGQSMSQAIGGLPERPLKIIALIGSEGGWTDDEIEQAGAAGWRVITLGGRTLRAETAAIAITAILQHSFGDLS